MSTLSVRRPLSVLAVLAMVATLLFAVVGTASAADPGPLKTATFSACPDNADIPDPGFSDVPAGTFFYGSVSCLAYYTVTTGVTPTTYDPGADVTRSQMALFLARGAAAAGVVLSATPPDAGFTDIAGLSVEAQTAINALADAGIVKGKTATTYEPGEPVLRQQMALFLTRFLGGAVTGPGGEALPATPQTSPFTDIGATTVEAHLAINQAWDLGIAAGTTATTYAPLDNVNRGQMALFLTRMYAHANTRPAGVNVQAAPATGVVEGDVGETTFEGAVTVRNADFTPKPNVHVDMFVFVADKATDMPFDTDGDFVDSADIFHHPINANPGVLEITDPVSSAIGNFDITSNTVGNPFATAYAWTAALGTKLSATTTYSSAQVATADAPPTLDGARLDIDDDWIRVPFGTAVTWSVQLVDRDEEALALAGVDVTFTDTWDDDYDDDPIVPADSGVITKVVKTDASGVATYTVTESKIADDRQARHVVSATFDKSGTPVTATNSPYTSIWSDVAPVPYELSLSTPTDYKVINETGTTPNSVTATVVDQYGDRYTGPGQVKFWSDVSDGLGGSETVPALTLNLVDGKATTNYVLEAGADSNIEVLQAAFVSKPLTHDDNYVFFWVDEGVAGDMYEGEIFWTDMDANELIIVSVESSGTEPLAFSEDGIFLLTWKADDRYLVEGVPSTMAEFETFIDEVFGRGFPWAIVNKYLDPADDGKTSWNVDEDDEIPG